MKKKFITLLFAITMIMALPITASASEYDVSKLVAKATSSTGNTIKVSWVSYKDAVKYVIYGKKWEGTWKKLKTFTNDGTVSATSFNVKKINGKKLKKHKLYRFYVAAYDDDELISKSKAVTCIAGKTFRTKYAMPTSVNIKFKDLNLERDSRVSAVAMANISSTIWNGKKHLPSKYGTKYRYIVGNPEICTINSSGTIHVNANAKVGSSTSVVVQEINGVYKSFNVNVVDSKMTESKTVVEKETIVVNPYYPYPYPYAGVEDGYYYGDIRYSVVNDVAITTIAKINSKFQLELDRITGVDAASQAQKEALRNERDSRVNMVKSLQEYILYTPTPYAYEAFSHEIDKIYTASPGTILVYDDLFREMKNNM